MPASTSTRLTLAHANASARLPKSVMSAQTATPTTHAVRMQPRRNVPSASQPGRSTSKSNAHQPSTVSSTNTAKLRPIPTSTNDACGGVSSRKRVIKPIESTPTMGQNSSSKKKNTLREPIRALRSVTAQTARSSFRQLNEDLLQLGLPHLHVPDDDPVVVEGAQQLREPRFGLVDRALDPAVGLDAAEDPGRLGEPRHPRRVQAERDHLAQADLSLQLAGRAARED